MRQDHKLAALDRQVGARIRQRRLLAGLTQVQLGAAIGVTFQSVQKYETGENTVGASRLLLIAAALATPPAWFLREDLADPPAEALPEDRLALRLAGKLARLKGAGRADAIRVLEILVASYAATPQRQAEECDA